MKRYFLFTIVLLTTLVSHGQLSFAVNDNFYKPDLRILIGENVGLADIEIQYGKNISFKDFSVRITTNASEADFTISDPSHADFKVIANNIINRPDLLIQVREKQSFPDISIEIRETGKTDYLIYSEIGELSEREIIVALLPVIHQKTKFRFKRLGEVLMKNETYITNADCSDIGSFIKKHGKRKGRLNQKKLKSSWLQKVEAYQFNSDYYVLADIKEMNEDEGEPMLQVFKTDALSWENFAKTKKAFDYEAQFRKFIYDQKYGCKFN